MQRIEAELGGPVLVGCHANSKPTTSKLLRTKIDDKPSESPTSLWFHIALGCFNRTPAKFQHFLDLIKKAKARSLSPHEQHRSSLLQDYLKRKASIDPIEDIREFIGLAR